MKRTDGLWSAALSLMMLATNETMNFRTEVETILKSNVREEHNDRQTTAFI